MNLTPWHERHATLEEERQFKKLITLHDLTHLWVQAISGPSDTAALKIERMPKITLRQNLWLLEKARLDELLTELNTLVGEQKVGDFLTELYETIWLIQLSTLENAFTETKDPSVLTNLLKNAAWSHGKKIAETEWANLNATNLNQAYDAFLETHIDGLSGFLLGRASPTELDFYWVKSPYRNAALNTSPQIEMLASLHSECIRGFFYGLSRKMQVSSRLITSEETPWINFTLLLIY